MTFTAFIVHWSVQPAAQQWTNHCVPRPRAVDFV